jgi:anthranilate phosphoribosyltransferase
MDIRQAIASVVRREDLSGDAMVEVMTLLMSGAATDAQTAAFLVGLQMKGVTAEELEGGATVMRRLASRVEVGDSSRLVDTCGTGGSGANKFNVSTASALVAACAGASVAKHGNRGATSKSGSADVLEAAGVKLSLTPQAVGQCIDQLGVGFMFAPAHHSAMKHVIAARKEIGVRTVFNLLGPLTNPAGAPNQVMGVFDARWIPVILEVLKQLGSKHVLVVAAKDGLDEISIAAPTQVGELHDGEISFYELNPEEFGIARRQQIDELRINGPEESLVMLKQALTGEHQAAADIVALNAGAAIYVSGVAANMAEGVRQAQQIISTGAAIERLQQLADLSASLAE